MNPVQYIIANQGLRMSSGKLAAQVAHAAVKGYDHTPNYTDLCEKWWDTGHTKIVLAARNNDHMQWARQYLIDQGFRGYMIIDEGRTEVPPLSPTALGFPILDKDDEKAKFAFSTFKVYKDLPPETDTHVNVIVHRALCDRVEALEREKEAAETGLDRALDVIERMEQHLDDESRTGAWLDVKCFGDDHQLYDDIMALPAPTKKETP